MTTEKSSSGVDLNLVSDVFFKPKKQGFDYKQKASIFMETQRVEPPAPYDSEDNYCLSKTLKCHTEVPIFHWWIMVRFYLHGSVTDTIDAR